MENSTLREYGIMNINRLRLLCLLGAGAISHIASADTLVDLAFENNLTNQGTLAQNIGVQWNTSAAYIDGPSGLAADFSSTNGQAFVYSATDLNSLVGHSALSLSIDILPEQHTAQMRPLWPYFKPGNNQTDNTPDFYLHKSDDWLVFPHELDGLTVDELRKNRPELSSIIDRIETIKHKKQ